MSNASSKKTGLKSVAVADSSESDVLDVRPATEVSKQPWGVLVAIIILILCLIIMPIIVQMVVGLIPSVFGWNGAQTDQWSSSSAYTFLYVLFAEASAVSLIVWFTRRKKMPFTKAVGLRKPRWSDLSMALMGTLAYAVLFVVAITVVSNIVSINTTDQQNLGFSHSVTGVGLVMAFVSLVILPPLAEEIMFRGFFYGTLRRRKIAAGWSIFITSIIFGSLHLFGGNPGTLLWIAFLDTFILSLVLCTVREKTGSIWAGIGIHALKNGFVFINLFIIGSM